MVLQLLSILKFFGGYPGIFIASALGNLVPFVPIPYLAIVYFYALRTPGASPLAIGIVSGLGGAVGKMAAYMLGRGARVFINEEKAKRYEKIGKMLRSYGALAAFLFAVTPSPDDAIVIPLGLMKYDVLKVFIGLAAGKIMLSTVTAYAGFIVSKISGYVLLIEIIASIILFIVIILLLTFLDWDKILETLAEGGWRGFFRKVRKEGLTTFARPRGPFYSNR